jgi:hypothetical protein
MELSSYVSPPPLCGLICQIRVQGFMKNLTPRAAPVFRHREINEFLTQKICRDLA